MRFFGSAIVHIDASDGTKQSMSVPMISGIKVHASFTQIWEHMLPLLWICQGGGPVPPHNVIILPLVAEPVASLAESEEMVR